MLREEREQVKLERPPIVADRPRPQPRLDGAKPGGRELMERRLGLGLNGSRGRLVGPPDAALDVGKNVAQLALGPCTVPPLLGAAEGHESPLAISAKSDRPASLPVA